MKPKKYHLLKYKTHKDFSWMEKKYEDKSDMEIYEIYKELKSRYQFVIAMEIIQEINILFSE